VSSAIPVKNEVNEEKGFSRGVLSFSSFLWTSKERDMSINEESDLKKTGL